MAPATVWCERQVPTTNQQGSGTISRRAQGARAWAPRCTHHVPGGPAAAMLQGHCLTSVRRVRSFGQHGCPGMAVHGVLAGSADRCAQSHDGKSATLQTSSDRPGMRMDVTIATWVMRFLRKPVHRPRAAPAQGCILRYSMRASLAACPAQCGAATGSATYSSVPFAAQARRLRTGCLLAAPRGGCSNPRLFLPREALVSVICTVRLHIHQATAMREGQRHTCLCASRAPRAAAQMTR